MGTRILQNCWRKMGFDWFPGLVDQVDVIADTTGDDNDPGNGDDGGDNGDGDAYDNLLFDSNEEGEESDGGDEEESDGGDD